MPLFTGLCLAQTFAYTLTGTLRYSNGPQLPYYDGASFELYLNFANVPFMGTTPWVSGTRTDWGGNPGGNSWLKIGNKTFVFDNIALVLYRDTRPPGPGVQDGTDFIGRLGLDNWIFNVQWPPGTNTPDPPSYAGVTPLGGNFHFYNAANPPELNSYYQLEGINVVKTQGRPDWALLFTQPEVLRTSSNLAFDSERQVTVMFGGRVPGYNIMLSDTWEYGQSYSAWNRVTTLHYPPARFWAGMAYDVSRKRTVLFGGRQELGSSVTIFNDTWEYDGTDWSGISTPHSPPAQDAMAMAYDPCRQKTVMFGLNGDTWEYDGSDWVQIHTTTSPPSRRLAALVYDSLRCRTILFGGLASGPPALSDTWEYDGTNWTQISTAISPSGRWAHAMAYDTDRSRVVLFGGYVLSLDDNTNDTWEYDGSTWLQIFPHNSPGPTQQHTMVYDSTRHAVVMTDGWDTWEYLGAATCLYSLSQTGQSFSAAGGLGSFTVNTTASCGWVAAPSVTWITILPGGSQGTGAVNYSVAPNTGGARSGSISVAGQTFNVTQAGFSCSYMIGPTFASVDNLGGNVSVSVSAPGGCPWTAVSNVGWLTVKSGASGSGGGMVVLNVAPNTNGARFGTATIAGQTFSVTQGAGACGALDVTSQMSVTRSGLTWIPFTSYYYSQTITVRNTSGSVIHGPVYLVLLGEPTHYGYPNDSGLLGSQVLTTCFSTQGDYRLLVSSGDMQAGQSVGIPLVFFTQRISGGIQYQTKVLSGTPTR
jgi:hypothetical protein